MRVSGAEALMPKLKLTEAESFERSVKAAIDDGMNLVGHT
jgi:hypothetical protein